MPRLLRFRWSRIGLALFVSLGLLTQFGFGVLVATSAVAPSAAGQVGRTAAYGHVPLSFEANKGQTDPSVDFMMHGSMYSVFLRAGEAVVALRPAPSSGESGTEASTNWQILRLQLSGADPAARAVGLDPLPGKVNYLIGNDPGQWHTDIPTYGRVQYEDVYPGVDVLYYGNAQDQLENDFVVKPGADPHNIRMRVAAADDPRLDDAGALVVGSGTDELRLEAPDLYQDIDGVRYPVTGRYVEAAPGEFAIDTAAYDRSRDLTIDPVLVYSTYLGGTGAEGNAHVAVDSAGAAYVTGNTESVDFPTTPGVFQPTPMGTEHAYVAKLNPAGTGLVYSTFIGEAIPNAIAIDRTGHAYITGTVIADFPVTPGAFQTSPRGSFAAKLNPNGTALDYSTFLGGTPGTGSDIAQAIQVDTAGNAYIAGFAVSTGFPTTPGAFQREPRGDGGEAFLVKLNPTGTGLVYSTLLGGGCLQVNFCPGSAQAHALAVNQLGEAYVTGEIANSPDFPTTPGAIERSTNAQAGFVTRFNASGSALVYSTLLGSTGDTTGNGIALDAAGDAFVGGFTNGDFPTTPGAFRRTLEAGLGQGFVSKVNPTGSSLLYSTLLSGNVGSFVSGVTINPAGNAFVTGQTQSTDFPTTPGAISSTCGCGPTTGAIGDGFVTELNAAGSALVYSTYLGGTGADVGAAIALDPEGNAIVSGSTHSSNFPTTSGAFQRTLRGPSDAFVSRIAPGPPACRIAAVIAGPPARLQVAVHADRGLTGLQVTGATNTTVALPTFTTGDTGTFIVTATKIDQNSKATFSLKATDRTGVSTNCDPAVVNVGREPGKSPAQFVRHLPAAESRVTITNGTPGVDRLQLLVNGQRFEVVDLHDGETRTVDISSAMRSGQNSVLVLVHGPRPSSAVVLFSDS